MKKFLVLVMLTTGLFAYDNNQYHTPNPEVANLYCLVTSFTLNGEVTHVNDRNRKQYKLDKYFQFIATRSYFYAQGESHNPALFSHSEPVQGINTMIDVYVNDSKSTYNHLARESEYKFHLMIQVFNNSTHINNTGIIHYDCTTNP
jgi:hypothetical protein